MEKVPLAGFLRSDFKLQLNILRPIQNSCYKKSDNVQKFIENSFKNPFFPLPDV